MKHIRKMVNGNKGFMSFMLIFFFLTAGTARNFVYTLPVPHKAETAQNHHTSPGKQYLSLPSTEDGSGTSFIDQLKDSDADDVEFVFFGNYVAKLVIPTATEHEFTEFAPYSNIYTVPLYDLFCNWKFHMA